MEIRLIAVPYDTGRRGYRMGAGPLHLLASGLAQHLHRETGATVAVSLLEVPEDPPTAEIRTAFELNRELAFRVRAAVAAGELPLVLSGNCNSAIGVVAGLGDQEPPLDFGVVWFDAHADFNTPDTSRSGFLDGTSLAAVTGHCWHQLAESVPGFHPVPESRVVLLGARDLDRLEAERLEASEIRRSGVVDAPDFYLHIDLDVLDPERVGAVNPFPAPDGFGQEELVETIRQLGTASRIRAVTISAYDPSFDAEGRVLPVIFVIAQAAAQAARKNSASLD
jgi:arginase